MISTLYSCCEVLAYGKTIFGNLLKVQFRRTSLKKKKHIFDDMKTDSGSPID